MVQSLLAILIGCAAAALQASQGVRVPNPPPTEVVKFVDELARAVRQDDRAAVAGLVQFPVSVRVGGLRVPFSTSDAFLARYDEIFTQAMREVIVGAAGPGRAGLTPTTSGAVIGSGAITIAPAGGRLRVTGIVVPPPADAEQRAASASAGADSRVTGTPRRIGVRAGPRPTRLAGSLARGSTDTYLVFVPKGQWLQVRLERVRQEASVRVVHAKTGAPLNPAARTAGVVASGRVSEGADYRIEVTRISTDEASLPYLIAVIVK